MFTIQVKVGRFLECRILELRSTQELEALKTEARRVLDSTPGKVVACVDYRSLHLLHSEIASGWLQFLADANPKIERGAALISGEHAISRLQISRIVREARLSLRRVFDDVEALEDWLGQLLTPSERARLHEFIHEPAHG